MTTTNQQTNWAQLTVAQLTVAHLFLGLILLASILLRLNQLDNIPLSPAEAEQTLTIWHFWHPTDTQLPVTGYSPFYFSATGLLTQFIHFTDATARLVPALFGIATVALAWLWRPYLGTLGTLLFALLLTTSPTHTALARTADGQSAAIFALLLFTISWLRYHHTATSRWLYLGAGALALGPTTHPLFYTGLITFALAWLAHFKIGPSLITHHQKPDHPTRRRTLLIIAAVGAASSTLFFWNLSGLGATADVGLAWLQRFQLQPDNPTIYWLNPILALARYEFVLLSLGLVALGWGVWHGRPLPSLCIYWFGLTFIFLLIQVGQMDNVAIVTIPSYLLISRMGNQLIPPAPPHLLLILVTYLTATGSIIYIHLLRLASRTRLSPADFNADQYYHILIMVIAFLLIVIGVNYAYLYHSRLPFAGLFIGVLFFLTMLSWGNSWWLGQLAFNDTRERWVENGAATAIRNLPSALTEISWMAHNDPQRLQIITDLDHPTLRWYLRDFKNTTYGHSIPPNSDAAVVLTTSQEELPLNGNYLQSKFYLEHYGLIEVQSSTPLPAQLIRWWLAHQSPHRPLVSSGTIWVRDDLISP
ncbi:MAG TPA: hypothetical protein VLL52_22825 [Anaerolineae bacterium]|nr:hypothetical protein [Anaerolineae bacterium]